MQERTRIETSSVPTLARHVKLRYDETRASWVLLAPERVLLPDETAVDILQRLDGQASVGQIAQALAKDYDASVQEIAGDVAELLQDLADKGFVHA